MPNAGFTTRKILEREIHEYFAIEFTGRECAPLFLRPGTQPGINLHKEDE